MTDLLIFAVLVPVMITLYVVAQRTRYGHLRISELPGCLLVLLAGKAARTRLAGILASRARPDSGSLRTHTLERELGIVPPSALEVRVGEFAKMMQAGSLSINEMRRAAVTTCDQCGVPMPHGPRAGIGSTNTVHFSGNSAPAVMGTAYWSGGGGGSSAPVGPAWKFCSTECREEWGRPA